MHVQADPVIKRPAVDPALTPRENYERALTPGPQYQAWPFHCFYCGDELHTDAHYPYCSTTCAVIDRPTLPPVTDEMQRAADNIGNVAMTSPAAMGVGAMFERWASDPNISVEKIERLMVLWERNEARMAESAFNAAMSDGQAEMRPVAADASNPQTKSRYASYEALDRALRPIYTSHGFALSFNTGDAPGAEMVRVLCETTHRGGHAKVYKIDMPADGKGAKGGDVMTKTHAAGSAVSYGMRYLLKMIFNVAVGEDDDDGNRAAGKAQPKEPEGYDLWRDGMSDFAEQGTAALQVAFQKSKREYREYITKNEPLIWARIKTKAGEVKA